MASNRKIRAILALIFTSLLLLAVLVESRPRNELNSQQKNSKSKNKVNHEHTKPKQQKNGKKNDKKNKHHDQQKHDKVKQHQIKDHEKEVPHGYRGHPNRHHSPKLTGGIFGAFAAGGTCGPDRCPPEAPCCSRWGYCGKSADHCNEGCQAAFGVCGADAMVSQDSRRQRNRKKNGFDLEERRQSMPDHDGRRFRIPPSVPKLPGKDVFVNIAYFPGWTQYRGLGGNNCHQRPYLPSAIPWTSLDYVMFAFAYFDEDNELYPADPSDEKLYFEINRLKLPTQTRVVISVGGWSFTHPESREDADNKHRFENMIRSPASRQAFISSCIRFCQFYGFDGIDIDYEFPNYGDRPFLTALFREMRQAFDAEGSGLTISIAGASFQEGIQGYELDKVSAYTDFVMIMTYDMYGSYDSRHLVNIHTTLVQPPTEDHAGHSVQGAVELYIDNGVPRNKIVLGLALYGKTFKLQDPSDIRPGQARFTTGGNPTSCIETSGDMAYNEIANLIHPGGREQGPVQPLWDPFGKAFYFTYGDRGDNWVGYDDRPSIDLKLQLATELDLAGVMWWSLDQDLDATSQESGLFKKHKKLHTRSEPVDSILGTTVRSKENENEQKNGDTLQAEFSQYPLATSYSEVHLHPRGIKPLAPSCPPITEPPGWMTQIYRDNLGKPGLVSYAASKRRRCPVVVQYPHFLPDTPVGNVVMKRCHGANNCPESWQAFFCGPTGWSAGSSCYDKARLSPALYFYGELNLIRTGTRDRNVPSSSKELMRASYKLSSQIGSKRPQYISHYIKLIKMRKLITEIEKKRTKDISRPNFIIKPKKRRGSRKRAVRRKRWI